MGFEVTVEKLLKIDKALEIYKDRSALRDEEEDGN